MSEHESESEVFFVSRSANNGSGDESETSEAASPQGHGPNSQAAHNNEMADIMHAVSDTMREVVVELRELRASRRSHPDGGANACRPVAEVNRDRNNSHGAGDLHRSGAASTRERRRRPADTARLPCKIPAFTGSEDWEVWLSRFEAIGKRYEWDEEDLLDNLLPRIEGEASSFVFSQLPPEALSDYELLVREMTRRYRVVETPQSFAAQFSRRNQKIGETIEAYAAELKRLYDKAHRRRDRKTRDEDLVRRFLDGVTDQEARLQVEFHKEPRDVEEAVYFLVNWQNMRTDMRADRAPRGQARRATDENHATPRNMQTAGRPMLNCGEAPRTGSDVTQSSLLQQLLERIERLEKGPGAFKNGRRSDSRSVECYHCHELGHFARRCPKKQEPFDDSNGQQEPLNGKGPSLGARGRSA